MCAAFGLRPAALRCVCDVGAPDLLARPWRYAPSNARPLCGSLGGRLTDCLAKNVVRRPVGPCLSGVRLCPVCPRLCLGWALWLPLCLGLARVCLLLALPRGRRPLCPRISPLPQFLPLRRRAVGAKNPPTPSAPCGMPRLHFPKPHTTRAPFTAKVRRDSHDIKKN